MCDQGSHQSVAAYLLHPGFYTILRVRYAVSTACEARTGAQVRTAVVREDAVEQGHAREAQQERVGPLWPAPNPPLPHCPSYTAAKVQASRCGWEASEPRCTAFPQPYSV